MGSGGPEVDIGAVNEGKGQPKGRRRSKGKSKGDKGRGQTKEKGKSKGKSTEPKHNENLRKDANKSDGKCSFFFLAHLDILRLRSPRSNSESLVLTPVSVIDESGHSLSRVSNHVQGIFAEITDGSSHSLSTSTVVLTTWQTT